MNPVAKSVLSTEDLNDILQDHAGWRLHEGKIVREWTFNDFAAAIDFVNRIAALAEAAGHHPDIDIRYNRVLLSLVSHDAGGVTKRDMALVVTIDKQEKVVSRHKRAAIAILRDSMKLRLFLFGPDSTSTPDFIKLPNISYFHGFTHSRKIPSMASNLFFICPGIFSCFDNPYRGIFLSSGEREHAAREISQSAPLD